MTAGVRGLAPRCSVPSQSLSCLGGVRGNSGEIQGFGFEIRSRVALGACCTRTPLPGLAPALVRRLDRLLAPPPPSCWLPMAPKRKPMSKLGGIEQTYRMFRAHVKLGSTRTAGPWRPTQAEAEADLATARGAESREAFAEALASLSRQPQDIVTLEYLASLSRPPQDTATVPPEGGQASASAAATQPALNREPAWRGGDAEPAL